MNQLVTDFVQNVDKPWQAEVCENLRQVVHQSVPGVEERIQYRKPHFLKNGKYVAVVGTAKDWVSFTIFNAENLDAPEGLFEDGPPERKTVKIREGQDVDYELLTRFVEQAASTV
jgi:hypothetical protein